MKQLFKYYGVILTALLSFLPASSYDFKVDVLFYNILSKEDRTVEVTYKDFNVPYVSGDLELPKKVIYKSKTYTVISIGNAAFRDCSLTSVTIPNSVTSIGNYAFADCSRLTSVTIPNSVTSIGNGVFMGCSSLTSVTIPNSVTSIGNDVFERCRGLENIYVEPENTNYASIDGILYSRDATILIKVPAKKINVTIPNSVTSIGDFAFELCRGLTSVTIPNSVTSIGNGVFKGCSSLTSVTIPNSVTSIGDSAFEGCSGLTSVTIPNSVTSIGYSAFEYCSGLTSVTIPNSVTFIHPNAFKGCSGLTSVTIPNSVTIIGYDAFNNCDNLKSIYMQCKVPLECGSIFDDNTLKEAILYVPKGTKTAYEKVDPWRNFWNIEEMDFSGVDGIEADDTTGLRLVVNNGSLMIDGLDDNQSIVVYDVQGRVVYRGMNRIIENIASGLYIVKVGSQSAKIAI